MKYIDLKSKLTELDKKRIYNYILFHGTNLYDYKEDNDEYIRQNKISQYYFKKSFIGVDNWLDNWSHSKQRLYRLLDNNFIKKIPFSIELNEEEVINKIVSLLKKHQIISIFKDCYFYYLKHKDSVEKLYDCSDPFWKLLTIDSLAKWFYKGEYQERERSGRGPLRSMVIFLG